MRVIILGGSGFIGRALTQALISRGDEVVVPTRHVPAATPSTGPEYQLWDGQDHSSLSQLLNGADAVINLLGENIAAKVSVAELTGAEFMLYATVGGHELVVRAGAANDYAAGDNIGIQFDMNKCHFFDADTEAAIR